MKVVRTKVEHTFVQLEPLEFCRPVVGKQSLKGEREEIIALLTCLDGPQHMPAHSDSGHGQIDNVATEPSQTLAKDLVGKIRAVTVGRSYAERAQVLADVFVERRVRVIEQQLRLGRRPKPDLLVPHSAHELVHAF